MIFGFSAAACVPLVLVPLVVVPFAGDSAWGAMMASKTSLIVME